MILQDDERAAIRAQLGLHSGAKWEIPISEPIDPRPQIAAVAQAIKAAADADNDDAMTAAVEGITKAIKAQSMVPLIAAISKIRLDVPAPDYSAAVESIVKAIDANTAAVKAMAARRSRSRPTLRR